MPLDTPDAKIEVVSRSKTGRALAERLNHDLQHHSATDVLKRALEEIPDLALVSSFGAEAVVLLHLTSMLDRDVPVLFVDTEMLFAETLVYQQEVAERLGLRNLHILRAADIAQRDPSGDLHRRDPDACCTLRKTAPLEQALGSHGGWITGRKRYQSGTRAELVFFEAEPKGQRIKVNPLAYWHQQDVAEYIEENRLPRHPLVAKGYPSIGCAPCTSAVNPGEDQRAGRWRQSPKQECGIHFTNGKATRTGVRS